MNQKQHCPKEDGAELEVILQKHSEMHEKLKSALKYTFDAALRSGYCILIFKPVQLVLLRSAELYPPWGEH